MVTTRLPDDQLLRLVDQFVALPWPITEAEAVTLLENDLGWTKWSKNGFKTGLPVTPDSGKMSLYPEGTVASIVAAVTDWSQATEDDRDLSQKKTFEHFAHLLSERFGVDATPFPLPRDHDAAYWELDNGGRLELRVSIGFAEIIECDGRWAVTSQSQAPGSALLVSNGHAEVLSTRSPAVELGAAVRRAWSASDELPQLAAVQLRDGSSTASTVLGLSSHDDLLRAGATAVMLHVIKGLVDIVPTRNTGPGGGFDGLAATQVRPEDVDDEQLGHLALAALALCQ